MIKWVKKAGTSSFEVHRVSRIERGVGILKPSMVSHQSLCQGGRRVSHNESVVYMA